MKKVTDNKLLLKIFSAIIAIILWFAITYTENPVISQVITNIPITFEGEDALAKNGLIITNKEKLPPINVVISGTRSKVISNLNSVSCSVDVSAINSEGKNLIKLKYSYPTNMISITKIKTNEIILETEKIISKTIPVKINVVNRDKSSRFIIAPICQTESVLIKGASKSVEAIDHVKASIDVFGITRTTTLDYPYNFYDKEGDILSDDDIIYKSCETVKIESSVYNKATLPVRVVLPEGEKKDNGFYVKNISVDTIDIGVPNDIDLDAVDAVITSQSPKSDKYEAEISVPEGVYVPEEYKTIYVSGEILPKVFKEISLPITVKNLPDGQNISLSEDNVTVRVRCIEKTNEQKIKASIDYNNIHADQAAVKIDFSSDEDIEIIGEYKVNVSLKSGE